MVCQTFDTISKSPMVSDEVFNKLTDNGNIQGLFMDNGQLYVNGEYINTRNFKAVTDDIY